MIEVPLYLPQSATHPGRPIGRSSSSAFNRPARHLIKLQRLLVLALIVVRVGHGIVRVEVGDNIWVIRPVKRHFYFSGARFSEGACMAQRRQLTVPRPALPCEAQRAGSPNNGGGYEGECCGERWMGGGEGVQARTRQVYVFLIREIHNWKVNH